MIELLLKKEIDVTHQPLIVFGPGQYWSVFSRADPAAQESFLLRRGAGAVPARGVPESSALGFTGGEKCVNIDFINIFG